MANPATTADIESRWRPLEPDELTVAATLLEDAWRMLRRHMTRRGVDIDALTVTDDDVSAESVRVLATAVRRVLQNPEGYTREGIDDHSWEKDVERGGELFFTDEELDALMPGTADTGRAFTIDPLADYVQPADRTE